MGRGIHSTYSHTCMCHFDRWHWNSRSRDFAHNLTYISIYTCYSNKFGFVSNVLWVSEFIPPTPICVTLTDDLDIQGHVIVHVTLPISATKHVATSFVLFLMLYGSGNSFQLLQNAWPWRVTLKFKVAWFLHMILPFAASTHTVATNLFLCLKV